MMGSFVERVLGVVAAADHAAAATDARAARRALAEEVRVGVRLAGPVAEVHGDVGLVEGGPAALQVRHLLQHVIRVAEDAVLGDAEHAACGRVVRGHLGFPVGEALPRAFAPDGVRRDQHRVRVGGR
jgi:hypothetical protein